MPVLVINDIWTYCHHLYGIQTGAKTWTPLHMIRIAGRGAPMHLWALTPRGPHPFMKNVWARIDGRSNMNGGPARLQIAFKVVEGHGSMAAYPRVMGFKIYSSIGKEEDRRGTRRRDVWSIEPILKEFLEQVELLPPPDPARATSPDAIAGVPK